NSREGLYCLYFLPALQGILEPRFSCIGNQNSKNSRILVIIRWCGGQAVGSIYSQLQSYCEWTEGLNFSKSKLPSSFSVVILGIPGIPDAVALPTVFGKRLKVPCRLFSLITPVMLQSQTLRARNAIGGSETVPVALSLPSAEIVP